jgi:glycosyltransferase involved in cell wall biosynthesis
MDELVSVIVNVYNCKTYLPKTLDSIREQSYRNLEVILVDDCSTDGSGEFCDEYCKQDERFRVIHHKKNTGVSGPRNTGLRNAKGEYIYFLDGDDYIHVEAIEALVEAIKETGLELSVFDYVKTNMLDADTHCPRKRMPVEIVSTKQMAFEMLSKVDRKWCVVWNKLYKRALINGLFFNDAYSIQDQDFNIRVYQKIEKAAFIPEQLYWYVNNPNSLQRFPSYRAKKFYLNTLNRFKMLDCIQSRKDEKKIRAWIIGYGFLQMMERRKIEKGTEYENDFRKLSKNILRNNGREFLFMDGFPLRKKLHFFSSWYFPHLYGIYARIEEHSIIKRDSVRKNNAKWE